MVEQSKNLFKFKEEKRKVLLSGLRLSRRQGEGFIIKGYGQVFLISCDEDFATLAFQSPSDFNHVEFHKFFYGKNYVQKGPGNYLALYKRNNEDNISMFFDFPRYKSIIKQELTSITQNLAVPIKSQPGVL